MLVCCMTASVANLNLHALGFSIEHHVVRFFKIYFTALKSQKSRKNLSKADH